MPQYKQQTCLGSVSSALALRPTLRQYTPYNTPYNTQQGLHPIIAGLRPILFEGLAGQGIAAGGQLTTTTDVKNFPGFPDGITAAESTDKFTAQSERFETRMFSEIVEEVDFSQRPFNVKTDSRQAKATTL